jgi:hypothetical protein
MGELLEEKDVHKWRGPQQPSDQTLAVEVAVEVEVAVSSKCRNKNAVQGRREQRQASVQSTDTTGTSGSGSSLWFRSFLELLRLAHHLQPLRHLMKTIK